MSATLKIIRWGCLTVGITLAQWGATTVDAADLRSNVGKRTIVRTAALEPIPDAANADAPPVPQPRAAAPANRQPVAETPEPFFYEPGEFENWGGEYWGGEPVTRWWGGVEFLMFFGKGRNLPALVTTDADVNAAIPASFRSATASVLYGGSSVGTELRTGGRAELGRWTDETQTRGYAGRIFVLEQSATNFNVTSGAALPMLGIPFINVSPAPVGDGGEDAFLVADPTNNAPAPYTGSINIRTTSDVMGGDFFMRFNCADTGWQRVDFLTGYQFSRVDENLTMTSVLGLNPNLTIRDTFETRNEFHGAMIGLMSQWYGPRVHMDFVTKIGLGNMHGSVNVQGQREQAGVVTQDDGIFARATNAGFHSRNRFAVVPEFTANCVIPLTSRLEFSMGYTFVFWSNILQPGGQIDRTVNLTTNNPARPAFSFNDNDFTVHGVNFSLLGRF